MSEFELHKSLFTKQEQHLTNLQNERKKMLEDYLQKNAVLEMKIKAAKDYKEKLEEQVEELEAQKRKGETIMAIIMLPIIFFLCYFGLLLYWKGI